MEGQDNFISRNAKMSHFRRCIFLVWNKVLVQNIFIVLYLFIIFFQEDTAK